MAFVIKADGSRVCDIKPAKGKKFSFQEIYKLIHCSTIQIIRRTCIKECILVDEDGKAKCRPVNNLITTYARLNYLIAPEDYIVGDVFVCNENELR